MNFMAIKFVLRLSLRKVSACLWIDLGGRFGVFVFCLLGIFNLLGLPAVCSVIENAEIEDKDIYGRPRQPTDAR